MPEDAFFMGQPIINLHALHVRTSSTFCHHRRCLYKQHITKKKLVIELFFAGLVFPSLPLHKSMMFVVICFVGTGIEMPSNVTRKLIIAHLNMVRLNNRRDAYSMDTDQALHSDNRLH